jgi:hypothetical protein
LIDKKDCDGKPTFLSMPLIHPTIDGVQYNFTMENVKMMVSLLACFLVFTRAWSVAEIVVQYLSRGRRRGHLGFGSGNLKRRGSC